MHSFKFSKTPLSLNKNGLIVIKNDKSLLIDKDSNIFFPLDYFSLSEADIRNTLFIGELGNQAIFAIEKNNLNNNNYNYLKANLLLNFLNPEVRKALLRSCQLLNWHHRSFFCGFCGNAMHMDTLEYAKVCVSNPKHRCYPQYSPSIIVLIRHGTQLLLGRSPHFTKGMYSTLAGFMEAGETAEEAVKREVMEEIGIEVKNIRPISTAPWPFPDSLMLGFQAEAITHKLTINTNELEDAQWFDYRNLPLLPPKATISYQLIERGVKECEQTLHDSIVLN